LRENDERAHVGRARVSRVDEDVRVPGRDHGAAYALPAQAEGESAIYNDLRARLFVDCGYTFAQMTALADEMFRKYAPRCNVGTLDLLHVAAAKRFGCRWFLSFDSNSGCRAVAHAEGLKLFPALNATDRRWLAKFK